MANPHKLWMMIGTFGAVTGVIDFLKSRQAELPTVDKDDEQEESEVSNARERVVSYAESHEGSSEASYFWADALGEVSPPYPKDWCGAFVLASLHAAGLAEDRHWVIGKGLEATLPKLTRTKEPQPGDIAYFTAKQHVAIVAKVEGENVELVNGNSTGNRVVINTKPKSAVTTFYSIQRYIDESGELLAQNEPLTVEVEP